MSSAWRRSRQVASTITTAMTMLTVGSIHSQPVARITAPAAATPTPSIVADANAAIADQLRDLANGKFDRILGGKKDRAAFEAFYVGRNFAPLWITDGKPNARAKDAVAYLGQVDADGLDPADYPVPNLSSLTDPAALAEAEIDVYKRQPQRDRWPFSSSMTIRCSAGSSKA